MNRKGVTYDAGIIMGMNWRPVFDPPIVWREPEIVRNVLHCNSVRIYGQSLPRFVTATSLALEAGLEVWVSPQIWNPGADSIARGLDRAARALEPLPVAGWIDWSSSWLRRRRCSRLR